MVAGQNVTAGDHRGTQKLEDYWLRGKGAADIRWGQGGDWYRCVEQVTKAVKGKMSPADVKGYCENLHRKATGMTTAEHTKQLKSGK